MIKFVTAAFVTYLLPAISFSQANIYDASTIPISLTKDAGSVKRAERIQFEIKNPGNGNYLVHRVITVLNANGNDELVFRQYSNKFRSLQSAQIKLYDAHGRLVEKYQKRDMRTFAVSDDQVDDVRLTTFAVSAVSYPVTLEIDYEISFTGFFSYESYRIQQPGQAVENSEFIVTVPVDPDIRYKSVNSFISPEIKTDTKNANKIYRWSCNNIPAKNTEDNAGNIASYFPAVLIAPNKIEYDGYQGNVSGWKEMGLWYNNLVKDISAVPSALIDDIKNLVRNSASGMEARIIYDYLQKNFRYVSIQLGIGSLKPYPASFVHSKKYGDCKALANYMQACLAAINIKSYNAWITADVYPPDIDPAFPYDEFNHQLLCVITGEDTTWLECTSKTLKYSELNNNTKNRYALLLTEAGGVLVRTPAAKSSENIFSCKTAIVLNNNASGKIISEIKTAGEFRQELLYVEAASTDLQKNYFVHILGFPNPDDYRTSFSSKDSGMVKLEMTLEKLPEFAAASKMFLNPRLYQFSDYKLPSEFRTQDYYFRYPLEKTDTTVYQLPKDFTMESMPVDRDLQCRAASFRTNFTYDSSRNIITSVARLVIHQQKIPVTDFAEAKKFFDEVADEFTDKIVIRKNE